jgi:hypothetical protein
MMIHIIFKRSLITLFFLLISIAPSLAQITLGYCDEGESTGGIANNKTDATISVAIGITPELQADYTFCSISFLRIYLVSPDNLKSLNVWVRKDLNDTESLTSLDVDTATLATGWNDIELPSQIVLNGKDVLYCGYSYQQSVKTMIPTHGAQGIAESFYVSTGSSWRDMSEKYGPVCLRAGLSSSYQNAMELTSLSLDQRCFGIESKNDSITLHGTIRNLGNLPLRQFSISVQDNSSEALNATYACDSIIFGDIVPFEFKFRHGDNGKESHPDIPIALTISQPNGVENESNINTTGIVYYEIGQNNANALALLIEEFTSEANGYAPAGQTHLRNAIDKALEKMGVGAPDVVLLSRHEGYGHADAWRVGNSDYEASFFGPEELTFAPAAMVFRNGLPFSTTLCEDSIAQLIEERNLTQYGSIQLEDLQFDADSLIVSVTISTQLFSVTRFMNPTLVVCIKQEQVASVEQKNYYPELYESDWQHDVVRKFFTLPNNGALFAGLDLNAVANGQVKVSDYASQQFSIRDVVPSDITSSEGLVLVAYIYDKGYTNQIISVFQRRF